LTEALIPYEDAPSAEASILGAALRWPGVVVTGARLAPSDFADPARAALWAVIRDIDEARPGGADAVTVAHRLDDEPALAGRVGGRDALVRYMSTAPTAGFFAQHVDLVLADSRRRRLLNVLRRGQNDVLEAGQNADQVAAAVEREILEVMGSAQSEHFRHVRSVDQKVRELAQARADGTAEVRVLPSPIWNLNTYFKGGGMGDGHLIVLAGRPGMGKTALAFDFVERAANGGGAAAFFSLEMSAEDLVERFYARQGGEGRFIGTAKGDSAKAALEKTRGLSHRLGAANLWIGDRPTMDISQIRAQCVGLARNEDLRLVGIDYLGLIGGTPGGNYENRVQEIGSISRGAKALARELKCPVLLLAQLNRGVESRTDKRPVMSDLRDSGEIEQDADVVLMCYRPSVYDAHSEASDELIVRKNRHGSIGTAYCEFDGPQMRWKNLETGQQ
jgi:replicative DNA helicase